MSQMQATGAAGSGDGTIVDGVSSSIKATVLDLASANPLTVAITDAAGDQITSFGGGTQYTKGDTDASPTGTVAMMEGAGDTLLPVQGTVADGLLVNLGANNDVTVSSSALPSGAATSAKQDTIIGHVDGIEGLLTTIDADTGALAAIDYATGADVASLAVVGGGAEATALRVTLADDSTGVVGVTDSGGSLTVDNDGTFQVQAEVVTTALTASAPATASVGVTSASAVATNSSRKGLILVNLSNSNIYLGFSGETAVVGSGVTLAPNGGSFEMSPMTFTTGAINAIADLASSTLAIQEWE